MQSEQSSRNVFIARLALGLVQGVAIYLLWLAFDHRVWPASVPMLLAPLAVVMLLIPLMVSQAIGNLRATTLLVWTIAASLIIAGLAWYDVWHAWPGTALPPVSPKILLTCTIFLFVAHALVSCGDADRKIVANYPTLFDLAWKLGVQAGIIVCFTASFWIMLWLGIALFDMIKLTGFGVFIRHPWVWIPLTTIAAAAAIHITDTRAGLVRGVRTLALTLLGWLLPVIALIALAFLIALVFTGLQPLWETRRATFLLIAAAAVLVIHINAAYQDGETHPPHILRVAGTLSSVLLIFIVWIAAYALWLRVGQYGWTVDRITSAACVVVAGTFAIGYLVAALLPTPWLKLIERWNVYGTFVFLIVLFALSTPIADPMRLSVADQMHRLQTGVVKAEKFDFAYLRWNGGRFGDGALQALSQSGNRSVAAEANLQLKRGLSVSVGETGASKDIIGAIVVHPAGQSLPASFVNQDWRAMPPYQVGVINECLANGARASTKCAAVMTDLDGDTEAEIIIVFWNEEPSAAWWATAYRLDGGTTWRRFADIGVQHCMVLRDQLLDGKFRTISPRWHDLEIGGQRLGLEHPYEPEQDCK